MNFKKLIYVLAALIYSIGVCSQEVIQAENIDANNLVGLTIQTGTSNYNGTGHVGYFSSGDTVKIEYNSPTDNGVYGFKFRMGGKDGPYELLVSLNGGTGISYVTNPSNNGWYLTGEIVLTLNQGANIIAVTPGWGNGYHMDEIIVRKIVRGEYDYTQVRDTLSINPIASQETKDLYDFLKRNYGQYIISGFTESNLDSIVLETGVYPMIHAFDFSNYTVSYPGRWAVDHHEFGWNDDGQVRTAILYYDRHPNAILAAQWHWHAPSGGHGPNPTTGARGETAGASSFYDKATTFSLAAALDPANEEYAWMIEDIDSVASQIQKFKDAKIPILFRPFHEMDGGWFWWGQEGEQVVRDAYDTLYNRLTYHHGLNNIIWIWGLAYSNAGWTPNDMSKIDIATWDRYGEPYDYADPSWSIDTMRSTFSHEVMIGIGEVGSYPDPQQSYDHDKMYSFNVGWNEHGVKRSNSSTHLNYFYKHPLVLDASETGVPTTKRPGQRY